MDKSKINFNQKIKENIFIVFLIFLIFSSWMYIYNNLLENKVEWIKYLFISWTIFLWYLFFKFILPKIKTFFQKIHNSKRDDIKISIIFPLISIILFLCYFNFNNLILFLHISIAVIILGIAIYFFDIENCLEKFYNKKENDKKWILISDKALEKEKDEEWNLLDKLWINQKAKDFAQTVWNDWNKEGFIFWLIAPWWHWKTSFLNLFERELEDREEIIKKEKYQYIKINRVCYTYKHKYFKEFKYKNKYEIFNFNPWYFESEKELLDKFLNWISSQLSSKYFLPRLDWDLKNLLNFLGEHSNGILNTKFNFWNKENLENIKENINISLKDLDKKLIIVIDDLDRVSSEKLKSIFKILDLCKGFYNTSYIICYDPNNFNNIDSELKETRIENKWEDNFSSISTENIDNKNLVKYIAKIINIQYPIYPDYDLLKKYFIELFTENKNLEFSPESKEWIKDWINQLFNREEFSIWWEYISDVRSMKRILNNFLAVQRSETKKYLKNIFYNLEFIDFLKISILSLHFNNLYFDIYEDIKIEEELRNSKFQNIDFSKIFNKPNLNINYNEYLDELSFYKKILIIDLFWNKNGFRNIENIKEILDITNWDIKHIWENAKFKYFIDSKIEEYKNGKDIALIIKEIDIDYKYEWVKKFIDEFKNESYSFSDKTEKTFELIDYILDNLYRYNNESFLYNIVILLENSVNPYNSYENCKKIWEYFYWKGKIINKLFNEKWWIFGLYWLLLIRLSLDRSRENSLHNFERWMVEWYDEKRQSERNKYFYLAKISKSIYKKFKKEYIDKKINIFEKINDNLFFIVSELSSEIWYFDESDNLNEWKNQKWWIKKELNNYFFDICFKWEEWIIYFINYLISNTTFKLDRITNEKNKYFQYDKFIKVLDKDKLNNFIKNNLLEIESVISNKENEKIKIYWNWVTEITYKELLKLFKEKLELE